MSEYKKCHKENNKCIPIHLLDIKKFPKLSRAGNENQGFVFTINTNPPIPGMRLSKTRNAGSKEKNKRAQEKNNKKARLEQEKNERRARREKERENERKSKIQKEEKNVAGKTTAKSSIFATSGTSEFRLPFMEDGTYNCKVYWDVVNNPDNYTEFVGYPEDTSLLTHDYLEGGIYKIKIVGVCEGWCFNEDDDAIKIFDIESWGTQFKLAGNELTDVGDYFFGCSNLNISATNTPNLEGTTNLRSCFESCSSLNSNNLSKWNVSNVIILDSMFELCSIFNQPLNNWNTSNVQEMDELFEDCTVFNQSLSNWDTSNVIDMDDMFREAKAFNQPLVTDGNKWNVEKVTDMDQMFYGATLFKQNLSSWNPILCTNFYQFLGPTEPSEFSVDINQTGTTTNYDALLNSWANKELQTGIEFYGGISQYSASSLSARNSLINDKGWTIYDGGQST
jgi:surface protein